MRKPQCRKIKPLAQRHRAWGSEDWNASFGSTLLLIMHTASLGLSAHREGAGLAWSLDAITSIWLPHPIMPMPDTEICPSHLPPCAVAPLSRASLFLQTHPVGSMGTWGCPACHVQAVGTRTPGWLALRHAHPHHQCTIVPGPYWTCSQAHLGLLLKAEPLAFIFISLGANDRAKLINTILKVGCLSYFNFRNK